LSIQHTTSKADELSKYRDLVLATIDYEIQLYQNTPLQGFNPIAGLESLKEQATEHFRKGRLAMLKRWFRDLTEGIREGRDFKFNSYIRERTGQHIDIFQEHFSRVDKIAARGRITTDSEYYDLNSMVDYLSQLTPVDTAKIALLNTILMEYQQRKAKKK
jgi:hypothetical protein